MKIAICAEKDDIRGLVPRTFREAEYLMIIETENNELQKVYPKEDEMNMAFAEYIVVNGCEAVICGPIEAGPFNKIVEAGITRYDGSSKKVQKAYTYMLRDQLPLIRDHIGGPGPVGHSHDYSCECGHEEEEEEDIPNTWHALISAGGMSSRMGDFKPLMELDGQKNIIRQIRTFFRVGVSDITIVIGHRGDDIRRTVKAELKEEAGRIHFLMNPDYATTHMFESVKLGLEAMKEAGYDDEHQGIFFVPVDVPLFTGFTLDTLMDRFAYDPKDVCIPTCEGQDGHPLLIRGNAMEKILAGDDSRGLQSVLAGSGIQTVRVEVPDLGAILDADTPEEYHILQREAENRKTPDAETCRRILDWVGVDPSVRKHGQLVAKKALAIAEACQADGSSGREALNLNRIYTACILHDILKGMDHHAERAGEMLKNLEMPEVASLVASHTTLPEEYLQSVNENMVVYLADKMISGVEEVGIEERFRAKREKFRFQKAALAGVESRYQATLKALELVRNAGWTE